MAMCGPGPIHQATDSKAFLTKASHILLGRDLTLKKPWSLQKDGDLWVWYERLARHKGLHSMKLFEVKAHTTDKDVERGIINVIDRKYNAIADGCADKGV